MKSQDKWNINRKPKKIEKISGVFFTLVILSFACFMLYASIALFFKGEASVLSIVIFFVILMGISFLFYRIAFTKPQKPSRKGILVVGYILLGLSTSMLILPFVVFSSDIARIFMSSAAGFLGIAGSLNIINRGRL